MSVKIDVDLKHLEKMVSDLQKAESHQATIGVEEAESPTGGLTTEYGKYLEFGWVQKASAAQATFLSAASGLDIKPNAALSSPPRPFFRATLEEEGDNWKLYLKNAIKHYSIENIESAHLKALELVAEVAQQAIQHTLDNGGTKSHKFPKRSPLTMAIYKAKTVGHKTDGTGKLSTDTAGVLTETLLHSIVYQIS